MKATNMIALTLVVIGALNWGLIGFFGFDLVTTLFHGSLFWLARVIFALVGLSGLWCLKSNKGKSGRFCPRYIQKGKKKRSEGICVLQKCRAAGMTIFT